VSETVDQNEKKPILAEFVLKKIQVIDSIKTFVLPIPE
jgi:hypothetical protein